MLRLIIAPVLVVAFLCPMTATHSMASTTINVPGDKPTIQSAIQAASDGDTIVVAPGTYYENLDFQGKNVTVESAKGPAVTLIDGGNQGPAVSFASSEGRGAVLKGFTIQHGISTFTSQYSGGGIYIYRASPTIKNNTISHNTAGSAGAGIYLNVGTPLIQGNVIAYNSQISGWSGGIGGGGISVGNASGAMILNNTIEYNSWLGGSGGGITLWAAGTPTIANNKIIHNSSYSDGGGLYSVNDSGAALVQNVFASNTSGGNGNELYISPPYGTPGPELTNNTIASSAGHGYALYLGGYDQTVGIFNSVVRTGLNEGGIYCDITYQRQPPNLQYNNVYAPGGTAYGGSCAGMIANYGNISANPLLSSTGQLKAGSPSIDAGLNTAPYLPSQDLGGNPRIVGATVDQGAYEYQG